MIICSCNSFEITSSDFFSVTRVQSRLHFKSQYLILVHLCAFCTCLTLVEGLIQQVNGDCNVIMIAQYLTHTYL